MDTETKAGAETLPRLGLDRLADMIAGRCGVSVDALPEFRDSVGLVVSEVVSKVLSDTEKGKVAPSISGDDRLDYYDKVGDDVVEEWKSMGWA